MNCVACDRPLVAGARFCPSCGAAVQQPAQHPADPLRLLLQRALGTHYEIIRELGRGGMGAVYLAHEFGLDRDVAIKALPPDRAQSEFYRQRFRLEARAAARLSHANIVPLHTCGEHDGTMYYVMGYVEGESLADRLRREGHLDEAETQRLLVPIADALHYAHCRGVLHRDVKPQNILIEAASGRPLLTDFGISKVATSHPAHTETGMILGTPEYMSPEQASGSPDLDSRSDQYALGLVAYVALSGQLPFPGRTPGEILTKRLTSAPRPLAPRATGVSPALVETVMRALAKDAQKRWPDCERFARAMAQHEEDEPHPFENVGMTALLIGYFTVALVVIWRTAQQPSPVLDAAARTAPALAGLVALILLGCFVHFWRSGSTVKEALGRLFRQPLSWLTWYPRPLRRRVNVWDRLPAEVRRLRAGLGVWSPAWL